MPGGWIYHDDLICVGHMLVPEGKSGVYLGWLLVEPSRHAPELGDLTEAEAERLGGVVSRVSRALRATEGAEKIYALVLGDQVPHLHVHVVARYPGTPREYWGIRLDEWPDAPCGNDDGIAALAQRLRSHLRAESR